MDREYSRTAVVTCSARRRDDESTHTGGRNGLRTTRPGWPRSVGGARNRVQSGRTKLTPEAASAKGDALLREMSKNLALCRRSPTPPTSGARSSRAAQRPREARRRARSSSAGPMRSPSRVPAIRRDGAGWYDGKHLTLVSRQPRCGLVARCRRTLDEALDFLRPNTRCACRRLTCCTPPPTTR